MVQHWYVCAIVFWRVVWYRAGTFLLYAIVAVHVVATSCPGRRARRGRGRGRDVTAWFFVAVMWLQHADEC